eukprot:9052814-Alexandrium_andersonii.AAC.1
MCSPTRCGSMVRGCGPTRSSPSAGRRFRATPLAAMPNVFVTVAPAEWTFPAHEGVHGKYAERPTLSAGPLALH